jgi:iron complex outermembrane recepter protein
MKLRVLTMALLATSTLYGPAPVMAQEATSAEPAGPLLEEIIVTARRREEVLKDVPISVTALSGDALDKVGVADVQALQYQTPSLSITTGASQRNVVSFAMRGQRAQESQLFTDPPVGTYFAEVVQPRPYGFGNAIYDLQSVQVLKGVQGTLFGRNMTGGAILVEPHHPVMDTVEGEIKLSTGNHDMREIYGVINAPLGEKFAVRVSGKARRRDGWSHEVTTGRDYDNQHYDTARISLLAKPWDGVENLTIFDHYTSDEHGTAAFLTAISLPSALSNYEGLRAAGLISDNIPAEFAAAQQLFKDKRYSLDMGAGEGGNLDVFGLPFEKTRNNGVTNKTTIELSDTLTLKNIFGYRNQSRNVVQDYDGIPAFLITPRQFAYIQNYSNELQVQGEAAGGDFTYIVGGYYFLEDGIDGSYTNTLPQLTFAGARVSQATPAALFQGYSAGDGYSKTYAGFAAGTYKLTPEITASGGVRYNYDKRKITVAPTRPYLGTCEFDLDLTTPGVQSVPIDQCSFTEQKSFDEVTYDATLQYQPSDEVTTYASFRHGFRAGGFSTRAQNTIALQPFQPEKVDEYELGVKTETYVGDGRLTGNLALFIQNGSNVQKQRASSFDTNGDGVPDTVVTVVDNTAKQRNKGGELEFSYATEAFTLSGFYSYVDVNILRGASSLTLPTGQVLPEIEQRGTPKHQFGLTGVLTLPVPDQMGDAFFTANYTVRSKIYLDDFEIEGLQPSYSLVNLRLEWNDIGRSGIDAALFGTNIFNKEYRVGVLGLIAEGLGFQSSVYGEPRMFGAELGYKF